jgi:predicted HicB family RNase H-like nuclease
LTATFVKERLTCREDPHIDPQRASTTQTCPPPTQLLAKDFRLMSHFTPNENNPLVNSDDPGGVDEPLRYASDPSPERAAELPTLELSSPDLQQDYQGRCRQALLLAEEAFAKTGSWVIFFREILGTEGVVRKLFADPEEMKSFMAGSDYKTLHEMLAAIRSQDQSKSDAAEPERMITIRIPKSLHEMLQEESKACGLSINKLSISKLLWPANSRFVPEQQGRRRGRKPGPQGSRARSTASESKPQPVASEGRSTPEGRSTNQARATIEGRVVSHSWADAPSGNGS